MSAEASLRESRHSRAVAKLADHRMLHIARLLPFELKTAPSGQVNIVHSKEGVGTLTSEYLGKFGGSLLLRVTAHLESAANASFWKEFELGYGKNGGIPKSTEDTTPQDFVGCPISIGEFDDGLKMLHHDYVRTYVAAQNRHDKVTSLIDRITR